jgi:hypothetical protein
MLLAVVTMVSCVATVRVAVVMPVMPATTISKTTVIVPNAKLFILAD